MIRTHYSTFAQGFLAVLAICTVINPVFAAPNNIYVENTIVNPEKEDGSYYYPFTSIQKAINASTPDKTISLRPGTYHENLKISNKEVTIIGFDPTSSQRAPLIVIEGDSNSPVITLTNTNATCHLQGLHITQQPGQSNSAIHCVSSQLKLSHCLITGHHISEQNPLILGIQSQIDMTHCTITDNSVIPTSSLFHLNTTALHINNSILWNNTGTPFGVEGDVQPEIRYSNIEGDYPGEGNLNTDPLFIRPGAWQDPNTIIVTSTEDTPKPIWIRGDYHLQSLIAHFDDETLTWEGDSQMSPCIDRGDPNSSLGSESVPTGDRVNIGAYGGTAMASKSYIDDEPVHFNYPTLKGAVEETLGIFDPTPVDMLGLIDLEANWFYWECQDLVGLEYAINLEVLILNNNLIKNVDPLSELTKLRYLDISDNLQLRSIYGLSHLPSLKRLDIHYNKVEDFTPLKTLPQLRELIIRRNSIETYNWSLNNIRYLTQLERIDVSINNLTSLDFLLEHTTLKEVMLDENPWDLTIFQEELDILVRNNPNVKIAKNKLRLTDPYQSSE